MITESGLGRLAGFLYLIVVVTGMFSLAYVPSQIGAHGDPHATLNNIVASVSLFRYGIASFIVGQVAFLLLPFVLYRLLSPAGRNLAVLMVALAVTSVPIALTSLTHRLDALSLATDAHLSQAFAPNQLEAMLMLSLDTYGNGLLITNLFWGLWLIPFGYLALKSGVLPKLLGILLMLGGLSYVIDVSCGLLVPRYPDMAIADYMTLPAAIGEIGSCLWLLVLGVRRHPSSTLVSQEAPA
jgi:hypothetical protein